MSRKRNLEGAEDTRGVSSRYFSTRKDDRREWAALQRQLEYGFPDTRQLYPEEDDNDTWYRNWDPYEELGPGSAFLRIGELHDRCWTRGDRSYYRWVNRWRRKRTYHWGDEHDAEDRCHTCFNYFGVDWDDKD